MFRSSLLDQPTPAVRFCKTQVLMCILSHCMTCPKLLLDNPSFFMSGNLWKEECLIVESNAHSSNLLQWWLQISRGKRTVSPKLLQYILPSSHYPPVLKVSCWPFWVVVASLHGHQQLCSSHVPKLHPSGTFAVFIPWYSLSDSLQVFG